MSIQAVAWVLEHSEVKGGKRCLMIAVANHADERGDNCWASLETLAREARYESTRGAQKALSELEKEGELEVHGTKPPLHTKVRSIAGMSGGRLMDGGGVRQDGGGGVPQDGAPPSPRTPKPSRTVLRTDYTGAEGSGIDIAAVVFEHWQRVLHHPQAALTRDRRRKIEARAREIEGTVDDKIAKLCSAIDGCRRSAFHMGENDNRKVYDSIELIFRNADKVDTFVGYATQADRQDVDAWARRNFGTA